MAFWDNLKTFQQFRSNMNCSENTDLAESYSKESSYRIRTSNQTRIQDIEREERANLAALVQHVERMCAAQKAHNEAVLERLGLCLQQDNIPPPQPPALLPKRPESSVRGRRNRPILEEKDSISTCKEAEVTATNRDQGRCVPDTPAELTPRTGDLAPSPPLSRASTRRSARIPVMTMKLGGAGKEVADGYKLQSAKKKMEDMVKTMEKIQHVHQASPQPPGPTAAPTVRKGLRLGTLEVAPKVPTPPVKPAPHKRKGPLPGTKLRPQRAVPHRVDLQSLANPAETLSLCFKQLASEDWEKKMDGLKRVQVLARNHSGLLQTKLHEVCLVLAEEVNNLRSSVAVAAMETVRELHVQLGKAMDPEAERTGRALLLKLATTTNAFIHQQANLALDALVEGCSPGRTASVLINTGLNHRCVAVRASTAQHLHQLADIIRVDKILTAGKTFAERFLFAVSKLAVDAASEVRQPGQAMLQGLAQQKEFRPTWEKVVPVKDRRPLQKILKKMRQ